MKSSKFICVADFHANLWFKYSKPCDDVNTRFHHQRVILRQIFYLARKKKANVVFDGDLFDSRGVVDCRVTQLILDELHKGANKMPKNCMLFVLKGNHDMVDNVDDSYNSIDVLRNFNNICVITHPISFMWGNTNLVFLPYSEHRKYLLKPLNDYINKISSDKFKMPKVLFGHLGVAGAKMGAHLVRLSGEFSLKDLHPDFFDWIILGHYHHRQFLNDSHHALYVGNTIPLRHEDDNQEKGVGYLDTSKDVYKFIPLDSPMFFTFNLDDIDKKVKDIKKQRQAICRLNNDNFIRVVSSDRHKLDWYTHHDIDTLYQPNHTYKSRLDIKPTSTSKQIVSKYCKKYAPSATKVSLEELDKASQKQKEDNDD